MSKILVTGGAGFIGYFISEALSRDGKNELLLVDNLARGRRDQDLETLLSRKNVSFLSADITDKGIFDSLDKDFEYIYHLAAVIGVKNVMRDPDRVLFVNAVSTLNVLEFAKSLKGLKKLLFSSTSEIYAGTLRHFGIDIPTAEDVPLTVDDITSERSTYALSKMYGESICYNFSRKFDIPVTIVRYHNVYGPRMGFAHVIPETFIKVLRGGEIDVPSPSHTRAFCYVDDAVEYSIRACESPETENMTLHIGNSEEETRIDDLVRTIAEILEVDIDINPLPDTPGSPPRRCPDISKIISKTGFRPEDPLREGIDRTYERYKDKLDEK